MATEDRPEQEPQILGASWKIAGLVTVDDRGQLVLPADVRRTLGVKGGDKFAVIPCGGAECPSAMTLVKVDELATAVKQLLGPALKEILD